MLIMPSLGMVVAQTENGRVGLAPVLSCTLNALDDIAKDIPSDLSYVITTSPHTRDQLEEAVWNMGDKSTAVLNYDSSFVDPLDYVALACEFFGNEVFRKKV
jgi:hypothetical protein